MDATEARRKPMETNEAELRASPVIEEGMYIRRYTMEEKKRDVMDELMGVLDSMSECAGKMIDATKVMIRLLSSGRLQLCDDAGENLTEEEPVVEEQQEPEAEVPCTFEEVRGIMASLSGKGKKAEARELLQKFGAKRLSEVQEKDYAALAAAAKAVMNG